MIERKPHPMLKPLWVRILLTTVCLGWVGVEIYFQTDWVVVPIIMTAAAAWEFFLKDTYRRSDG